MRGTQNGQVSQGPGLLAQGEININDVREYVLKLVRENMYCDHEYKDEELIRCHNALLSFRDIANKVSNVISVVDVNKIGAVDLDSEGLHFISRNKGDGKYYEVDAVDREIFPLGDFNDVIKRIMKYDDAFMIVIDSSYIYTISVIKHESESGKIYEIPEIIAHEYYGDGE